MGFGKARGFSPKTIATGLRYRIFGGGSKGEQKLTQPNPTYTGTVS